MYESVKIEIKQNSQDVSNYISRPDLAELEEQHGDDVFPAGDADPEQVDDVHVPLLQLEEDPRLPLDVLQAGGARAGLHRHLHPEVGVVDETLVNLQHNTSNDEKLQVSFLHLSIGTFPQGVTYVHIFQRKYLRFLEDRGSPDLAAVRG